MAEKAIERNQRMREYAKQRYQEKREELKAASLARYHAKPKPQSENPVGRPKGLTFPQGYKKRENGCQKSPEDPKDIVLNTPEDVSKFSQSIRVDN